MKNNGMVITQGIEDLYNVSSVKSNKYSEHIERDVFIETDEVLAVLFIKIGEIKIVISAKTFVINKKARNKTFSEAHEWCDSQIKITVANSKLYNDN